MSADLPYFPFYAKDFLTSESVAKMTPAQVGVYVLWLCHSWANAPACTLPDDDAYLRIIARLDANDDVDLKPIKKQFDACEYDGRIRNKRLYEIYLSISEANNLRSKAGEKGAKARWGMRKPLPSQSERNATPMASEQNRTDKNRTNSTPPLNTPPRENGFEAFWKAYPRKVGKGAAERKWRTLKPDLKAVLDALAWQVPTWTDVQFIPHPATWLNRHGWLDEKPPTQSELDRARNLASMSEADREEWLRCEAEDKLGKAKGAAR